MSIRCLSVLRAGPVGSRRASAGFFGRSEFRFTDNRSRVPRRRARCYDGRMVRGLGGFAMFFALAALVGGCSANILHGIDERSANEATAALERAGIGAEKMPDEGASAGGATYTIRVARADSTRAVDLLRALG